MLTRGAARLSIRVLCLALLARPACADDLLRFGRIATLAPLCGLRDDEWAFDLRRAELQADTGSPAATDEALRSAPGSARTAAALASAEHEALEEFAERSPARTCAALRTEVDLAPADEIVRDFRARREIQPGS